MPRDGSPALPQGVTPAEPMSIGQVANPPFAILPKPGQLFLKRADRFATLAPGHELQPYLEFLAKLARAQHDVQSGLPQPNLPSADRLATARANAMPPLSLGQVALDETADHTLVAILDLLQPQDLNDTSKTAVETLRGASAEFRRLAMRAVLLDEVPSDAIAAHVLAAAAVQVHFACMAAQLDVDSLQSVADAACPVCGGGPVSSMVVGWEGSHGTRFCTCSICATHWHVPRIRCVPCGTEKGIAYHSIEGGDETVMGETCESCRAYVKMLHQFKNTVLDPVADDVASLGLDLTLTREGFERASVNPFLIGY